MDTFYLIKQLPNCPVVKFKGYLSIDSKTKQATFWTEDSCIVVLEKAEIQSASSEFIVLRGFEPTGTDKSGRPTFKYQEWALFFITSEDKNK